LLADKEARCSSQCSGHGLAYVVAPGLSWRFRVRFCSSHCVGDIFISRKVAYRSVSPARSRVYLSRSG
jgi:hypothetical protein